MVDTTIERLKQRLLKRKLEDGHWLRKYVAMATDVGVDEQTATTAASKFDKDVRQPFLQKLMDNISTR